jgi:cell division protein FtsB
MLWISLASLAGFVLVQTAVVAFFLGGLAGDVKNVKEQLNAAAGLSNAIAGLTAVVEALKDQVGDLKREQANIRTAQLALERLAGRLAPAE